jgi:translation initiation factor IF-1
MTGGAMGRRAPIETTGMVLEVLPKAMFKVEIAGAHHVLAHVAPRMERNFVRLTPGDRVRVELSPYDHGRGRITRRLP